MKSAAWALCLALIAPAAAAGQPAIHPREMRFTGPSAADALCTCLLDLRRSADAQGRLDFTAEVELVVAGERAKVGLPTVAQDPQRKVHLRSRKIRRATVDNLRVEPERRLVDLTARVWAGSAHAVGRIDFAGHSGINDSTLRRAMTIHEREPLDVRQLRRSLSRINDIGVFEPLTLADISVARRDDGVTADLTIPLRERKRRWWSLSAPMFPGFGTLQASVSSRLPPWGRGVFEATTYFVSLNVAGFARPFLALQRPVVPGQELFSGFAVSPALSPRAMLMHYGRAHLAHRMGIVLDVEWNDPLTVPITSAGRPEAEPLNCVPPKPRLWWLRRAASAAANVAFTALIP
jgi:hypothetical protein